MAFTSYSFLLFTAALLVLYYALPQKAQWPLLLAASCFFYLHAGLRYLIFLLFTALTTYAAARAMDRESASKKAKRPWLMGCLGANFALLFVCKVGVMYSAVLPLGMSFYIFQSIGYVIDVYRGTAKAEKNFLKLALFVCFFPQLIQGPISRFNQLAPQLYSPHAFDGRRVSFGLQRMLWGYFKKLVIADRIAVAVAALKGPEYTGISFLVLTVFYAIQIYADFTGGIDIALGLSEALGITLAENFIRPFSSKNTAEYWRRWHISLGTWMKDYIFYPLSVSRPMLKLSKAARKKWPRFGKRLPVYIASAATWFVTGIWHGLTPNFVVWGMLNCLVIVVSEELTPLYRKFHSRFHLKQKAWYGWFETLRMFALMNLIRACDLFPHVGDYWARLGSLFSSFHVSFMELGLKGLDYLILAAGVALMLLVSLVQEKRGSIRELLWNHPARYALTFLLFLATLLMGRYGMGYEAGNFIYNQF